MLLLIHNNGPNSIQHDMRAYLSINRLTADTLQNLLVMLLDKWHIQHMARQTIFTSKMVTYKVIIKVDISNNLPKPTRFSRWAIHKKDFRSV